MSSSKEQEVVFTNHEKIIKEVIEPATWQPCTKPRCKLNGMLLSEAMTLRVPIDYQNPQKKLKVQVRRFRTHTTPPKVHFITLAGGPGGNPRSENYRFSSLAMAKPDTSFAFYVIAHRGYPPAGSFVPNDKEWGEYSETIKMVIEEGPFPVQFMTTENAALDTAYLTETIRASSVWIEDAQIMIHGFSYGSRVADRFRQLTPNLAHAIVLAGLPDIDDPTPTIRGISEHCELDEKCNALMGGDVHQKLKDAILNLIQGKNPCIDQLIKTRAIFLQQNSLGERLARLSDLLFDLVQMSEVIKGQPHTGGQYAFLFIQATSNCSKPEAYPSQVLQPMLPLLGGSTDPTRVEGNKGFNTFLNYFVNLVNSKINYVPNKQYWPPDDPVDLHGSLAYNPALQTQFDSLHQYLGLVRESPTSLTNSPGLKVSIIASRLDLTTTYQPAYFHFEKISGSIIYWILLEGHGHDGYYIHCTEKLILSMMGLEGMTSDQLSECFKNYNNSRKIDWVGHLRQGLWDQIVTVKSLGKIKEIKKIPNFMVKGGNSLVGKIEQADLVNDNLVCNLLEQLFEHQGQSPNGTRTSESSNTPNRLNSGSHGTSNPKSTPWRPNKETDNSSANPVTPPRFPSTRIYVPKSSETTPTKFVSNAESLKIKAIIVASIVIIVTFTAVFFYFKRKPKI